ncbi:unnamed protein product [Dibothriocephalus latus]|uniref:Reverse transcriptase domain-containing protein n=1 Tax=Dibothriocephalus latus TaxID=60516 RepID=A0A3P7MCS8_DIBLA|nr:unnamed protein product [Dibothriocephalus latus]
MAVDGVPPKIIVMIKAYYRSATARVLAHNNFSKPFAIQSGVRQDCVLSLVLFNYVIDWVLGEALQENEGIKLAPAASFGYLQSTVSRVNEVAKSAGLSKNAGKTKVFSCCIPAQEMGPLEISGCQLEEVDGSLEISDCQLEEVDSLKYFRSENLKKSTVSNTSERCCCRTDRIPCAYIYLDTLKVIAWKAIKWRGDMDPR